MKNEDLVREMIGYMGSPNHFGQYLNEKYGLNDPYLDEGHYIMDVSKHVILNHVTDNESDPDFMGI